MDKPTWYIVSFSTWNAALQQYVTRNYKPKQLSDTISAVNWLIENQRQDIAVDELAAGKKKLTSPVVKRWGASELLVANCEAYPIQGADPEAY